MTPRLALPLLASVALVAGCGGSSSTTSAPQADRASTTPSSGVGASTSAAPGAAAAKPGSSGAAATPAAGATTAAAPGAAGKPAPAAAKPGTAPASSSSTAPGTYTYDTSGTFTAGTPRDASGTATLTVDPAVSNGTQHSTLSDGRGKTEQDVVVRPNGTYLSRLVITNPAFTKEFRLSPAVLLLPEPATNGRSYSWTARSTDGKTTASVTARIDRRETLTIGGARVPTIVVKSTLRLTGDITYTGTMETWRDPAHRLTVQEHAVGKGVVSGFAFSSDITSVVRSTRPS